MYTALEMPIAQKQAEAKGFLDFEAEMEKAYNGLWTVLTATFAGCEAGTRVKVTGWINAGFNGQQPLLVTADGRSLGYAFQSSIDSKRLLRAAKRNNRI